MIDVILTILTGLTAAGIWALTSAVKDAQRMLYAITAKKDSDPQPGDSIVCANGKGADVLWRLWDGAEECLMVHYQDGSGLDKVSLDTLVSCSLIKPARRPARCRPSCVESQLPSKGSSQ